MGRLKENDLINIPPLRVKRFTAQMRELSIRDAIALAAIPASMQHAAASFFMKCAVTDVEGAVEDPELWTVQERTLAICHYMSSTYDDGPDFTLNNGAKYSDYLAGKDFKDSHIDIGEVEGDAWTVRHMTGRLACSIERLVGEVDGVNDYTFWQVAIMAAQMVPNGLSGDELTDSDLDQFILERINVIASFPESVFAVLLSKWHAAVDELQHLVFLAFDDEGTLCLSSDEGGSLGRRPARFPAGAVVTSLARGMGGKHED